MSAPAKIEALLFDLGGVVIDIDIERVFAHWAKDAGLPAHAIRRRIGQDEAYLAYECGAITLEAYFASLRRAMNVALSDDQLLAGWNAIFVGEMAGIAEVLARYKSRVPMYAFSNTNQAHIDHFRPRFGPMLGHFQKVFTSCDIGLRKPDKPAFDHVVREIGVPAGSVLFFDDSEENVTGAKAAGLTAEHVKSSAEIAAALRKYGDSIPI